MENTPTIKRVTVKVKKIQGGALIPTKKSSNEPNECTSSALSVATTPPRWRTMRKRIAGVLTVLASIATILVLFVPTPITKFFSNSPQSNSPTYYSGSDWLQMDVAGAILEGTSHVQLYADSISEVWKGSDTAYYDGATLIALFSNQDEHEKIITKFRIYANDIVENLSPDLHFYFWQDELTDPISCEIYNNGWGETGNIQITFLSIQPMEGYEEYNDDLDIYLQDGACTFWELDSVNPGTTGSLPLLSGQDFVVEYKTPPEENFFTYYSVAFIVEAPEQNYATTMELPLFICPDYVMLYTSGLGGGEAINYVVWIDTSSPTYSAEYPVYQRLPGNEIVCIPMFIVPEKSCTMSVQIEFETLEGEIIQATPLNHANFIIPYYENQWMYLDGNLLDWDNLEGKVITCLPFSDNPGDVNVAFPFVNSSMIIPSETVS